MLFIKLTALIDAFRLDPDTELQTDIIHAINQVLQSAVELMLIDEPVAERMSVIVAVREPSIVHDKHFHAALFSLHCQFKKKLPGEVEIGCLPAVDQDRADCISEISAAYVPADTVVHIVRKTREALRRISHDYFRTDEFLSALKRVSELFIHETHLEPCLVILVFLAFRLEASAVHKCHRPAVPCILVGRPICKNDKRVVLVRRHSPPAAYRLIRVSYRHPVKDSLHSMPSMESYQIIITCYEVQHCTLNFFQIDLAFSAVANNQGAGDDIDLRKYTVKKFRLYMRAGIFHKNVKRLRIFRTFGIYSRKSG